MKLYGEGRRRFFPEKLIKHCVNHGYNCSDQDTIVYIIDLCYPKDQVKHENFWMNKLETLHSEESNMKRINQ